MCGCSICRNVHICLPAVSSSCGAENLPLGLPADRRPFPTELMPLAEVEKFYIQHVLDATQGSKVRTSEVRGISRPTLDKKIREYGLRLPGAPQP